MPSDGKKGLTVRIDEELHAEVRHYLESHEMTMTEFVTLALQNELHPKITIKEEKYMGNMKTLALQIPEDLFQRIKDYLHRNNMTQKEFVIGLIENELEREQTERENTDVSDSETVYGASEDNAEEQDNEEFSDGVRDENEEAEENDEYDSYDEDESETENMGFSMGM